MISRLAVTFTFVGSLLLASQAYAVPIPAVDLDTWLTGPAIAPALPDVFTTAAPPPLTNGSIVNGVFFDGTNYTYTHEVTPSLNNNFLFNTGAPVSGFTGTAGWSFSSASAAGGAGNNTDFLIQEIGGTLLWVPMFGGLGWDKDEPITFFFVSSKGPGIGDYNLSSTEVGTAQSFAPVPEPGSLALLGSGLVGLYAAVRRRLQYQA